MKRFLVLLACLPTTILAQITSFPPCANFEETSSNMDTASSQLQSSLEAHNSCYKFEYSRRFNSPFPPTTHSVEVRNGQTLNADPSRDFNDILAVMAFVQETCVDPCLASVTPEFIAGEPMDAVHECHVAYNADGVPTRVTVDPLGFIADDEYTIAIENFAWIDCTTGVEVEVFDDGAVCSNWEDTSSGLEAATTQLSSSLAQHNSCYNFQYTYRADTFDAPRSHFVTVRNAQQVNPDPAREFNDILDVMFYIQGICVEPCEQTLQAGIVVEDAADPVYSCSVTYQSDGVPLRIDIDPREVVIDEEWAYTIDRFEWLDCEPAEPEEETCTEWQDTSSSLDAASLELSAALTQHSSCYNFDYTYRANTFDSPRTHSVQVRNAQTVNADASREFNEILDVMFFIQSVCVDPCENSVSTAQDSVILAPDVADPVHTCQVTYGEDGVPTRIFVDPEGFRSDDEYSYTIENFEWVDCSATGEDPPEEFCSNWEEVSSNLVAASTQLQNSLVQHSSCYNFQYTHRADVFSGPTTHFVQVRNAQRINPDASREFNEILDVMFFIQNTCVDPCQTSGVPTNPGDASAIVIPDVADPVYSCQVSYRPDGVPTRIDVDPEGFKTDDDYAYTIDNFDWVDCATGEVKVVASTPPDSCNGYEQVMSNYLAAQNVWESTGASCYTYQVEKQGRIVPEFRGPFLVQVSGGNTASVVEGYQEANMDRTIDEWFDLVYNRCLAGCDGLDPDIDVSSTAYQCSVDFSSSFGFPTIVQIDQSQYVADEEDYFVLSNFQMIECESDGSMTLPPPTEGNPIDDEVKCNGWEEVAAEFEAANATLVNTLAHPEESDFCYTFTYLFRGFIFPPPSPVEVVVKNGQPLTQNADGSLKFGSLNEVMFFIRSWCIDKCPSPDGPVRCAVEYNAETGVPEDLYIDLSEFIADEEISYGFSDFSIVDCSESTAPALDEEFSGGEPVDDSTEAPPTETTPASPQSECEDYDQARVELFAAKDTWVDPPCYDFTFERLGEIPEEEMGPFVVKVRNGVVVDDGGANFDMSIADLIAMIEETCFSGCPVDVATGASACQIKYRDDGAPLEIFIDYDETVADEEDTIRIENIEIVDCAASPGDTTDEPPQSETPPEVTEETEAAVKCVGYEELAAELNAASQAYLDPQCYQYIISRGGGNPLLVTVQDGVVVSPDPSTVELKPLTMNELIEDFRSLCVDSCPGEGAFSCQATFSTEGHILSATIVPSSEFQDETVSYEILDFEEKDCSDLTFAAGVSSGNISSVFIALALTSFLLIPIL